MALALAVFIFTAAIAFFVYEKIAQKTQLKALAGHLNYLFQSWSQDGRPFPPTIDRYMSRSSDQFFVFTNVFTNSGKTDATIYAVRSSRVQQSGFLAITTNGDFVWIDQDGKLGVERPF